MRFCDRRLLIDSVFSAHSRWLLLPVRGVISCFVMVACLSTACAPELEKLGQQRSPRGSLGDEVYKALCRRVAGTEMPKDITGQRSDAVCLGDAAAVQQAVAAASAQQAAVAPVDAPGVQPGSGAPGASPAPGSADPLTPRLIALAARRAELVRAIDDTFPVGLGDELELLFRGLIPFYDPDHGERVQKASRELAAVMKQLAHPADPSVLDGLARVARKGMVPREGSLGLTRATLAAAHTREMARSVLALTEDEPAVRDHFNTLMSGLALELATIEVNAAPDSDLMRLKRLLVRSDADFGSGTPLYSSVRDARGLPSPTLDGKLVPYPFVDANADGVADANGAALQVQPSFTGRLPEPFWTSGEGTVARDASGRALALAAPGASAPAGLLYQTQDADTSLLAGALRAAQKLFRDDTIMQQLSLVSSSVVGDLAPTTKQYGALSFPFMAPDQKASPLLDLVHGSTALLDRPITPSSLALTKALLDTQEAALANSLAPMLTLERRTRPGADAYPNAKLAPKHVFWDEMLFEAEQISRRRMTEGGETLLEALLRASLGLGRNLQKPGTPIEQIVDLNQLRHQGVVLATLMRFKDEWRGNPKKQADRAVGEPVTLGAFRTPVDRTKPDTPATCGRDGCGGLIAGTLFEPWKQPNQNCAFQRLGRPITGKDCGQAPNQSLMQRSLGLIAEMAGRGQCNKPITLGNLLDFAVLKDPCVGTLIPDSPECVAARRKQSDQRAGSVASSETAVRDDYACPATPADAPCKAYANKYPAAFVDTDGAGPAPAAIQACHMLDLPDVGRTFGDAVLHTFQLKFPNPWVRRYLEDVARAGDPSRATCDRKTPVPGFPIVDPTVVPDCIPEAARLSRDVYTDMPATVDTLGELVEFLLDDNDLFTNPEDERDLRPEVKALSRVLFAAAGSTSFVIFDPLLLSGAPPLCAQKPALPACSNDDTAPTPAGGCCIKDLNNAPLRYRLDTFYGTTSFAWNQDIKLADGTKLSFIDTMKPFSDAMARFDFDAARGDDPKLFEDKDYLLSTIGKLVAQHYDSSANTSAQSSDPNGLTYRRLTGMVSYEEMAADALDDGSLDYKQLGSDNLPLYTQTLFRKDQQLGVLDSGLSMLQALAQLNIEGSGDGIHITAEATEQLLNPHARCAGPSGDRRVIDGIGACDRQAAGVPGLSPPFTYRDGRATICWDDGRCFDGTKLAKRFVSPLYVMLDAVDAMDTRSNVDPEHDHAARGLLSGLLDAFATVSNGRFDDRRVRALLSALIDTARDRVLEEQKAGTLATYAARTDQDALDALHSPILAGGLGMLNNLHGRGTALSDLSAVTASSLSEAPGQNNLRVLLSGLFDLVQLLPGDAASNAALRSLGMAFDKQVDGAVAGTAGALLAPQDSAIGTNLYMLRQTAALDTAPISVLERVLQNVSRVPDGRPSPLEVLVDVMLDVERVSPAAGSPTPSGADLRVLLDDLADVMLDPKRGFERLYAIVKCTVHGATTPGCE